MHLVQIGSVKVLLVVPLAMMIGKSADIAKDQVMEITKRAQLAKELGGGISETEKNTKSRAQHFSRWIYS